MWLENLYHTFMIKITWDFTTPSLVTSDKSRKDAEHALESYRNCWKWEDEVHPFVFCNEDLVAMTFINVNVNDNGVLLWADGGVVTRNVMSCQLVWDLKCQKVSLGVEDSLERLEKVKTSCQFVTSPRNWILISLMNSLLTTCSRYWLCIWDCGAESLL